jgi:RNA-directed DNA polymerase
MPGTSISELMSLELQKVAERARREPEGKFNSLCHLIDEEALARAYRRLRKDAAVGVDGVTVESYGQDLGHRLRDLHERLRTKRYRHQPIRRMHIPKGDGRTRPIGISATEDKVVQGALREALEAVYEQDFLDCSYGFRPGRSAHDAVRALNRAAEYGQTGWILEADIVSFFDSIDRKRLLEILQARVPDGSMLRLVGKCLHVGVLDGELYSKPSTGTAQGSVLSPLLGNIYLHHVVDVWFEREIMPQLSGAATLVRYADDLVIALDHQHDAVRVMNLLKERLQSFGLTLHPEKTRLVPFGRPPRGHVGKGPGTFDFLGFTWYWRRTRAGRWSVSCKTRTARLVKAITAVYDFCRRHRHESVQSQHAGLCRRLRGHFNYFGVNGNGRSLQALREQALRSWFKWLRRRSQRHRLTWKRYRDLLRTYPLPRALITVPIWE